MASKEEVRKAFALFDANGDGMISLDELKAILCRPTAFVSALRSASRFGFRDRGSGSPGGPDRDREQREASRAQIKLTEAELTSEQN